MTNLRAEKTRRRTDDDLVPQGFVAVHTLEPLSCLVKFFIMRFPSITMVLALERIPSGFFHMILFGLGFAVTLHITVTFLPSTLLQLRREQLAPKAVLEHQNDNPWE